MPWVQLASHLLLGVRHLTGQEAAGSSSDSWTGERVPNVPVSNYPTSPIIDDRCGDAEVRNAHPRLRAKGDRVHRSQAQFSEHDAVVEHIASGHEGSTLWKSLVTTGSSMTVVRSRMSCKGWRCWRRPPRPYGPRSHNKYSSPLTCNHDEPTIRTHSNRAYRVRPLDCGGREHEQADSRHRGRNGGEQQPDPQSEGRGSRLLRCRLQFR